MRHTPASDKKAEGAIGVIREAVQIRNEITEHYRQYRALSTAACQAALVNHNDLKRAVDALYYFGGGWPTENSKGRMEALLDNFVGMYRILDFIGEGAKVRDHLAVYGISIKLDKAFKIDNVKLTEEDKKFLSREYNPEAFGISVSALKDTKDLVTAVVMACMDLQGEICSKADKIKDELRPKAKEDLGIEDEEYLRLEGIVRIEHRPEKIMNKKVTIHGSMSNFNKGLSALGTQN